MNRTLVETDDFTNQLHELGDLARLDDALTGVYWALSTKPEVYDIAHRDIRV